MEQLVLSDVVTLHYQTDRTPGQHFIERRFGAALASNGLHLLCAVGVASGTRMRIVLVQVGEDLRVSEVWRHSRRTCPDRRGEQFPSPPMAGARLLRNSGER